MHAHFPRERTCVGTMRHRPTNAKSQKEENRWFSAHYRKHNQAFCLPRSPRSPRSPAFHRHHGYRNLHGLTPNHSSHDPCHASMLIPIFLALRRWLLEKGFKGYIQVAEAPPHPDAQEIAKKLNVDRITNGNIRKKLGLTATGEKYFEIPPIKDLEKYFGEYSTSAKAYRTKDIPNSFFREVVKFLLEVECVHINAYGMPKASSSTHSRDVSWTAG